MLHSSLTLGNHFCIFAAAKKCIHSFILVSIRTLLKKVSSLWSALKMVYSKFPFSIYFHSNLTDLHFILFQLRGKSRFPPKKFSNINQWPKVSQWREYICSCFIVNLTLQYLSISLTNFLSLTSTHQNKHKYLLYPGKLKYEEKLLYRILTVFAMIWGLNPGLP